jgi:hypothetical protein
VSIDVILLDVDKGVEIAATQNDISLDGSHVALIETLNGHPDCAVAPEIEKESSLFGFQPPGCQTSGNCTGMRAIILSFSNTDPIPSGSRLYSCNVAIKADADVGATYALPCSIAQAASPAGEAIGVECDAGAIEVVPIHTPGPTPEPDEFGTCYESASCDQFPVRRTRAECCQFWLRSGLPCTWCPDGMVDPASGSCTACEYPCAPTPTPTSQE